MNRFAYARPDDLASAVRDGMTPGAKFLAGGTNLVDLMKENVERPASVVDLRRLPFDRIEDLENGGLRLGALVTNSETAFDQRVADRYPLLVSAILAGASPQLRNAATNGGNLNQRTRCYYFYDTTTRCNKRKAGSGCSALTGVNRIHAVLGASSACIATHPSDMAVALAALNAQVRVTGPGGDRVIEMRDYHRLPGDAPDRDTTLAHGEIVTAIDLPADDFGRNHTYLKLRDRLSYAFALVSVAVAMKLVDGQVADVRIALGGVAHKPWRDFEAERDLVGQPPTPDRFDRVAKRMTASAIGHGDNDFKIELARKAIVRALRQAASATPQSQVDKRVA